MLHPGTLIGPLDHAVHFVLYQSEQLQVRNVFDDGLRRDVRNVFVGTNFRLLHRGAEPFGGRRGTTKRHLRRVIVRERGQQRQH
jgi:hypothetical protein